MQSIVSSIEEEDIQQKVSKVTLSRVSSMTQQSFTVNEVLELGQGKARGGGHCEDGCQRLGGGRQGGGG